MEQPQETPLSHLRMSGGRYNEPGYPLEGLLELVNYERLVVDVAKALWLTENPDRVRTPKGFTSKVRLRLVAVEDGSAIPVLIKEAEGEALPDVDPKGIVEKAQSVVDEAFNEIIKHNRLPDAFPPHLIHHFLRLGRTLHSGEAIEFGTRDEVKPLKFTQEVRTKFLAASQDKDFPIDDFLAGRVVALDTTNQTFKFLSLQDKELQGSYTEASLTEDLRAVFHEEYCAPIVRLKCTQTISPSMEIKCINDVAEVEVLLTQENLPWRRQIESLLTIEDGWLDGSGTMPQMPAIERTRDFAVAAVSAGLPEPGVFPLEDGGVQLQWFTDTDVWTATISPDGVLSADYLVVEDDIAQELASPAELTEAIALFRGRMGA